MLIAWGGDGMDEKGLRLPVSWVHQCQPHEEGLWVADPGRSEGQDQCQVKSQGLGIGAQWTAHSALDSQADPPHPLSTRQKDEGSGSHRYSSADNPSAFIIGKSRV